MVLALAACAAGVFAFATTAAQAATPGLAFRHVSGHTNAAPAGKGPKPKEYTLCTEYFGSCGPMYVYKKTSTWETPTICWVYEGEGCPGLGNFQGPYIKEAKGKVTYDINGAFGEPDAGVFEVTKIKKSHPAAYKGPWYLYGVYYGEVTIET
jgi:hypothetical protein